MLKNSVLLSCRDMMHRFAGGDINSVYDMITGDESWTYCYNSEKRQYTQWVLFYFEELPTEVKRGRSVGKTYVLTGAIEARGDGVEEGVLGREQPLAHRHAPARAARLSLALQSNVIVQHTTYA
ncbi:hypothetical protein EVAR_11760_1 [Eumeta japonica]|uniref:Uncharacterized protein n=1 Tax=Eumeta variegata TaxID=151549 RepID=A0A4C1UPA6_EUMVA|nr:hypothetical protein EVAR_11760_1 [Eumeta japonica]